MSYPKLTPITAKGATEPRYLEDRFADVINVKDFGAKGDGVTDDSEAFQAAGATGKPVLVPNGEYVVSQPVSGVFFGTKGAKISYPLNFVLIDEPENRIVNASYGGSMAFVQPYDKEHDITTWGRAIQGACYDKYDNILYCSAAYAHQGNFIYAFDYETKNLLGTNYDESVERRGAFYNKIAHQGLFLYRPTKEDEPLFFTTGPKYVEPDVIDISNTNKLRLIKWDYNNPTECTIVKEWLMFDTSVYSPGIGCLSEDGSTICVIASRVSDGAIVACLWNVSDILETTGSIYSKIRDIIESPWGTSSIVGQCVLCDENNIYCLSSGAGEGEAHFIKGFSANTGVKTFERAPSYEGFEIKNAIGSEGEVLCFLPINSKTHLCLATTVFFESDDSVNVFYDLEKPASLLSKNNSATQTYARETQTSADLIDVDYSMHYIPAGYMTDLSSGGWFLNAFGQDNGYNKRQIAYRGNGADDVRTRVINGSVVSDWRKFLLDIIFGTYGTQIGWPGFNDNNAIGFRLLAKRDTLNQSCSFISRYRSNTAQGETSNSFTCIGNNENTNWTSGLSVSSAFTVGVSSIDASVALLPSFNVTQTGKTTTYSSSIGNSNQQWSNIYASSGPWASSDLRKKDNISEVSEQLVNAWGKVGFKVFQMKEAINKKGQNARLHVGVIAQEVAAAFTSEGLDVNRYGLFGYDSWEDKYEENEVIDKEAVLDNNGNEITPATTHIERHLVQAAGDTYSIRYEEALVLECAYLRSCISKMQEQINTLIERINQLTK